jgi:hypothetical protein
MSKSLSEDTTSLGQIGNILYYCNNGGCCPPSLYHVQHLVVMDVSKGTACRRAAWYALEVEGAVTRNPQQFQPGYSCLIKKHSRSSNGQFTGVSICLECESTYHA